MGFLDGGFTMKAMVKKLAVDGWLAEDIREAAKAQKLTVPAYIRRAVVRQLVQDLQSCRVQAVRQKSVGAKVGA